MRDIPYYDTMEDELDCDLRAELWDEVHARLKYLIDQLPPKSAVILREFLSGKSINEIAAQSNVSYQTIWQSLYGSHHGKRGHIGSIARIKPIVELDQEYHFLRERLKQFQEG